MAFYTIRKRKGKKHHYLIENRRIDGKVRQFGIYLGAGDISKEKLKELIGKKEKELKKKVDDYLRKANPFYSIFSDIEVQKLEEVKKDYAELKKKMYVSELENYEEWFTVEYTYDSNRIEGSTLSKQEVSFILYDKRTPAGKSFREIYEVKNHKDAYDFVKNYNGGLTLDFVLKIHHILMSDILPPNLAGHIRETQVYIRNAKFTPAKPKDIEPQLRKLIEWYKNNQKRYHPIVLAAHFHVVFETIHPFVDGNGRTGRLLLNYILSKGGFPPVNIESSKKLTYISMLEEAQLKNKLKPFSHMLAAYIANNPLVQNYRENVKNRRKKRR